MTTKWHLDPCSRLAAIDMGRKLGAPPLFGEGRAGSPSNTKSPGPRLYVNIPGGILIHPAIWPQQIWAENWGLCPFGEGELGPHLTHVARAWAYPHAKFRLDLSNRLATVHQRYREVRQTGRQTTV